MRMRRNVAILLVFTLILSAIPFYARTGVAQDASPEARAEEVIAPETGPVFVYQGLRVSVIAAVHAPAVNALGLRRAEDREWVVVAADITNIGSDSVAFDPGSFSVYDGNDKLGGYAKRTTSGLAESLGGQPLDPDAGVEIAGESTIRVFWVYRIEDSQKPDTFGISPGRVPLNALIDENADLSALPEIVSPLPFREVLVDRFFDSATISVYDEELDEEQTIVLIGVDAPFEDDCYGEDSVAGAEDLAGSSIWLESTLTDDSAAEEGVTPGLAWVEYDGTWTLLNQLILSTGNAGIGDMLGDARYESWMRGTEGAASRSGSGLWAVCDGPHGSPLPTPTPEPTPTPLPPVGTRDNPLPIGQSLEGREATLTVIDVIPDAWGVILAENQYNDPPREGMQFFIATIEIQYTGNDTLETGGAYGYLAVGQSGVSYTSGDYPGCGLYPNRLEDTELFPGGTISANLCWEIRVEDVGSLTMYIGDGANRVFFALYR